MVDPNVPAFAVADASTSLIGSPTRAFLFSDLREYTSFVEEHGAAPAADLLLRYRSLVRDAVSRFGGAEIKTEGDSFYVVFPAVSDAVKCGINIVEGARETGSAGAEDIRVGVGIHAGETVETPDGPVGSAVNVAARICALARPGEVLVSDTVRVLTASILDVQFASRGRHRLKGVAEAVPLYAVHGGGRAIPRPKPRLIRRLVIVAAAASALLLTLTLLVAGGMLRPFGALSNATSFPTERVPALEPGRYVSTVFRPPFEVTLPAGWTTSGDFPDALGIGPVNRPGTELVFLRLQTVFEDRCSLTTQLVSSAAEVIDTLQARPDLEVADPRPVAYGGVSGIAFDVTPSYQPPCHTGGDEFVGASPLWPIARDLLAMLSMGITTRVIILDAPGHILTVQVAAEDSDLFWLEAEPVLATLRIVDE